MAESPFKIPTNYIPDPTTGRPVSSGSVYFGVADTDPETLANRISVVVLQEDKTRVTIAPESQPLSTLAGGVIEYNGSPVDVLVDGVYSVKVLDSNLAQKYYNPRQNETATVQTNEGVAPVNGSFEFDTQTTGQPDNWTIAPGTNGTVETDTDSAHGLKSLKFTGTDATGGGTATSDKFDVLAGGSLSMTYTYKSSVADTLNKIEVNWYNSADALISTTVLLSEGAANPTAYTSATVHTTAPSTAKTAEVVITGVDGTGTTTTATSHFDGFCIRPDRELYPIGVFYPTEAGITASAVSAQGERPLTAEFNEITGGGAVSVVTLPPAYKGRHVFVHNVIVGAYAMVIYPASGDDLGNGVDNLTALANGSVLEFRCFVDGIYRSY